MPLAIPSFLLELGDMKASTSCQPPIELVKSLLAASKKKLRIAHEHPALSFSRRALGWEN